MKKFLLLMILTLTLLLSACNETIKIPVGVIPTEKFTTVDYIQDNAIFQADSKLVISGKAQSGVVMVASLYDSKGDLVQQVYSDTDKLGVWQLSFITPGASNKNYKIKISDSNNTFFETYDEIKFGEVWFVLGDKIDAYSEVELDYIEDDNKMVYVNNEWINISDSNSLFINELLESIYENSKANTPVGVVAIESVDSYIYQWLSRDSIDSRNYIKEFLVKNNLYIENDNDITNQDMTYYQNYLTKISGMSAKNIIWNQGESDTSYLQHVEPNLFANIYFQMLYTFMSNIEHDFNILSNIYVLQAPSKELENIQVLREIESQIANYFGKCVLIPTYDLNYVDENAEEQDVLDLNSLINRINLYETKHIKTPCLDKLIKILDDFEQVSQLILTFANVKSFDEVDAINGLVFYDESHNPIELDYVLEENKIIINLSLINEEDGTTSYIKLSKITYACEQLISECNLKSDGIPVIPFQIILNNRG